MQASLLQLSIAKKTHNFSREPQRPQEICQKLEQVEVKVSRRLADQFVCDIYNLHYVELVEPLQEVRLSPAYFSYNAMSLVA